MDSTDNDTKKGSGLFRKINTQKDSDVAAADGVIALERTADRQEGKDMEVSLTVGPYRLKPCRLSTIAKLLKIDSPLLHAEPETIDNPPYRAAEYIIIQDIDRPLEQVIELINDPKKMEVEAWRIMDNIEVKDAHHLLLKVILEIGKANQTKVKPVAEKKGPRSTPSKRPAKKK